ncbi:MAG: PKD domain-containing protein [Bacteroidales bacterium]
MKIILYILVAASTLTGLMAQSDDFYEISRLPFTNDRTDDFAPAFFREGLVFTSNRKTGAFISRLTEDDEILYNIFYTSGKSEKWDNPDLFAKGLKSIYHDGPVSFSPDGSKIYFTRNVPAKGKNIPVLGIFMANWSDGEWIDITPFPYNSDNYNLTHPCISPDGKTLYFASDMPGGFGGMDIYKSEIQGKSWTAPANLGEQINSGKDEVFPYFHSSGRLYFSSNNNPSNIYDLFFSMPDDPWRLPVRLPAPFNSEADDFGFIADNELINGYFTSNREGSDNIYSFVSTFPLFTQCESIKKPALHYDFYEASGGEIDTLTQYFEWDMGDGTLLRGIEVDHRFSDVGTYNVRLNVIDNITGEIFSNIRSLELVIPLPEQAFINSPDSCFVNEMITLDASSTNLPNLDIDGYYWDLGDGHRSSGETITHRFSAPGVYEIRLGVMSDPDSPYGQQKSCVIKNIVVIEMEQQN